MSRRCRPWWRRHVWAERFLYAADQTGVGVIVHGYCGRCHNPLRRWQPRV